jgi:hypothetical protein
MKLRVRVRDEVGCIFLLMPEVLLDTSPLLPGVTPVNISYRESGEGPPLLFLHGGWGYEIYSFRKQIAELSKTYRCLAPDRKWLWTLDSFDWRTLARFPLPGRG